MTGSGNDKSNQYASPPCFMHEVDPAWFGLEGAGSDQQSIDVARWRKAERTRLIEARLARSAEERAKWGTLVAEHLEQYIGNVDGIKISAYWPFRGEPDLRPLMDRLSAKGACTALPVVIARGTPLVFREWKHGAPLERGVWNIPIPAEGAEMIPDIVIAPVVGFDPQCYRLGYGGGFFDRTLAAMSNRPLVLGVGYSMAAIPTIYPQQYDIPMNVVITENGIVRPDIGV
jgi:5-formyltetrahydrofolate cyclo-ligase